MEFQTDQTIEDREESSFTFTYLPENKEDVEEFSFVTSTGITKKGIILDQSGTHTDTSFCTGCAQSPDHPIDIEISWITVEGEEFDKAITLN
ncbi:hypothetical protein JCM19038_1854 [Geomicrobium sp. JCM 19038]|nr:hypothetical protein JCM19038_1854 [Geomicrobium sp. JCM 19038]